MGALDVDPVDPPVTPPVEVAAAAPVPVATVVWNPPDCVVVVLTSSLPPDLTKVPFG